MKKVKFVLSAFFVVLMLMACVPSIEEQMDKAESIFIEEVQYMSKEEALSKEINYYKDPNITVHTHTRSLSGKDLIHECNRVMKEDDEDDWHTLGPTTFKIIRRVDDIKDFAIHHPDEYIANEFYFVGTFTHFANGYGTQKAKVIYVPKLDRYIIDRIYK